MRQDGAASPGRERTRTSILLAVLPCVLVQLTGCEAMRRAAEDLVDRRTPRERYVDGLALAGLAATALARDWTAAADRALRDAPLVSSPHEEQGYLTPAEPAAIALRVRARRGQEVQLDVELPGDTTTTMFLDAWSVPADSSTLQAERLASADSGMRTLRVVPRHDGDVVLRLQPELLRGGRFRATVRLAPTLAFPVRQGTERDVGSRFGAPRDAGSRSHHGIDIFAPRGTPALAAAPGTVNRVSETPIGGKVVWLRDVNGNSLYYAHLDRQVVTPGMQVNAGDTVGFVGNTGNARTTPPHLHFGVYRRGEGPVDPWWFVYRPRASFTRLVADTARLGQWVRPRAALLALLTRPARTADTVIALERHSAMRVLSAAGEWYRVRLPDGTNGFVSARATEAADRAIATVSARGSIVARPVAEVSPGDVLAVPAPGDPLDVLARFGEYALVRSTRGIAGWVIQQ